MAENSGAGPTEAGGNPQVLEIANNVRAAADIARDVFGANPDGTSIGGEAGQTPSGRTGLDASQVAPDANLEAPEATPDGLAPLDDETRGLIEQTTGETVPGDVQVSENDAKADAAGVLGMTQSNVIRLSSKLGGDPAMNLQVRLHEAAHQLQFRRPTKAGTRPGAGSVASAEREATAVAEAALRGRRRPIQIAADRAQTHNFTTLFDPLQSKWDHAAESAAAQMPAAAKEPPPPTGTDPDHARPEGQTSAPESAPLPEEAAAPVAAEPQAQTDNSPEPVERAVRAQAASGTTAEGEENQAQEAQAAQQESEAAARRIAAAVDRLFGRETNHDPGPAPTRQPDAQRVARARGQWDTGAREKTTRALRETQQDFGEQGLSPDQDPYADLDPAFLEEGLQVPEVDVAEMLDPAVAESHLGAASQGLDLSQVVMFDPDGFHEWIAGDQVGQLDEMDRKIAEERSGAERELSDIRGRADRDEQAIRDRATTDIDTRRQAWQRDVEGDVAAAENEMGSFIDRKSGEATGHVDSGNEAAQAELRQAQTDADGRMRRARQRAREKRREADSGSWVSRGLNWIREKASAVVDWCRDLYNRAERWCRDRLADARRAAERLVNEGLRLARETYAAIETAVRDKAGELWDSFVSLANDAKEAITGFLTEAKERLTQFASDVMDTLASWRDAALEVIGDVLEWGEELLETAMEALGNLANLVLDWIGERFPVLAEMIRTGSLEPLFDSIAEGVASVIKDILDSLGISDFIDGLDSLVQTLGGGDELAAAMTGDCDAFERVLERILGKLDEFLASDRFQEWKAKAEAENAAADEGTLDKLMSIMDFVRDYVGPVWETIQSIISGIQGAIEYAGSLLSGLIDWIKEKISAALDIILDSDIYKAIEAKITEWWNLAAEGVNYLVEKIKAGWELFRSFAIDPIIELWNQLKSLWEQAKAFASEVWEKGKEWLASVSQQLIQAFKDALEPVLSFIDAAAQAISEIVSSVVSWAQELGLVQILLAPFALVMAAVQAIAAPIIERLGQAIELVQQGWELFKQALSWLAENLGPFLEFVVGFVVALGMLATGNFIPMALFIASNAWRAIPCCYREAIVKFVLDALIKVVEALPAPAQYDFLGRFIRQAALGFLQQLREDEEELRQAMLAFARIWGGTGAAQFMLGFLVGVAKGVWEGTVGTLVFLVEILAWLGKLALGAVGVDFGDEEGEEGAGEEEAEPEEGAEQEQEGEPEGEPAQEEATDSEAPPEAPADLQSGFDLFKEFLQKATTEGFTRDELKALLDGLGSNIDDLGTRAGQSAAEKLIEGIKYLAENAYEMGEVIGLVVGVIVTELVIAYFTAGGGAAASGAKWALKLAKAAPKVVALLKKAKRVLAPVFRLFDKLKGALARWARAVRKWIDDMIDWFRRKLRRKKPKRNRNRNRDRDDDDDSAESRLARRAATDGWNAARSFTRQEAKTEGQIERHIARHGGRKAGGINVELKVHETGRKSWKIRATAKSRGDLTGKKATRPVTGGGWIALPDGGVGTKKYVAEDMTQFNRNLLREAADTLERYDEGDGELRGQYRRNVDEAQRLERRFQGRLDQRVRGLKFTIDLEGFNQVEDDERIQTDLKISPNSEKLQIDIPLNGGDFDDLLDALRRSPGNREFPMLDRLERVLQTKAREHNCTVRITPYRANGYSYRATFSRDSKSVELFINQTQANQDCAACNAQPGQSRPHNVVSASQVRNAVRSALGRIKPHTPDTVTEAIVGAAAGFRAAATQGREQQQCSACENQQSHFSLIQRRAAGNVPAGDQFDNSSPTEDRDLTRSRINRIVDAAIAETRSQAAKPANSGHWIKTDLVDAGLVDRFRESIRRQLWRNAQ